MKPSSASVSLTKDQAAVLAFVLGHVQAADEIETLSFRLAGEFGALFYAAVLGLGIDEDGKEVSVLVTLPVHSSGVFLALTVGQKIEVARMLANLEDYERDTGRVLQPLEVVVTDGPHDIKALLLLHTVSYSGLAELPDNAEINSRERRFSLVVSIDSKEYDRKTSGGIDALLDMLQDSGKSLFFFD